MDLSYILQINCCLHIEEVLLFERFQYTLARLVQHRVQFEDSCDVMVS